MIFPPALFYRDGHTPEIMPGLLPGSKSNYMIQVNEYHGMRVDYRSSGPRGDTVTMWPWSQR
jgi:hypothetical protein